jgi:DNA-binding transcriptional MerR regulator
MSNPAIPNSQLPPIPSKRYFTIGEVSLLCGLKSGTLRYWEQEFPVLKPMKRKGNRRYYQKDDILMIRHIRHLVYERGYTLNGARQTLAEEYGDTKISADLDMEVDNLEVVVDSQLIEELEAVLVSLKKCF